MRRASQIFNRLLGRSLPHANFAEHQKELKVIAKTNNGMIETISVNHGLSPDGNFYHFVLIPKSSGIDPIMRFTVKIQQDLTRPGFAKILRTVEKSGNNTNPAEVIELEVLFDDFNYHYVCSRWLMSFLYEYRFIVRSLDVMLPPRIPCTSEVREHMLERFEVIVDSAETDEYVVDFWLDRIRSLVAHLIIRSDGITVKVKDNEFLRDVHAVEIYGKTDLDWEWIYTSTVYRFHHHGIERLVLTDHEIKEACEHFNDPQSNIKIMIFDQGTVERGEELKKWLREKHPDHKKDVDYFYRKVGKDQMFYFEMKHRYLKFGKYIDTPKLNDPSYEAIFPEYKLALNFT